MDTDIGKSYLTLVIVLTLSRDPKSVMCKRRNNLFLSKVKTWDQE